MRCNAGKRSRNFKEAGGTAARKANARYSFHERTRLTAKAGSGAGVTGAQLKASTKPYRNKVQAKGKGANISQLKGQQVVE